MSTHPDQPAKVLAYADGTRKPPRDELLLIARICGGLPLGVGLLTFVLYVLRPMPLLIGVAAWTVFIGTGTVVIGLICLAIFYWYSTDGDAVHRRWARRQAMWCLLLLLSNFPAAYLCTLTAFRIRP